MYEQYICLKNTNLMETVCSQREREEEEEEKRDSVKLGQRQEEKTQRGAGSN